MLDTKQAYAEVTEYIPAKFRTQWVDTEPVYSGVSMPSFVEYNRSGAPSISIYYNATSLNPEVFTFKVVKAFLIHQLKKEQESEVWRYKFVTAPSQYTNELVEKLKSGKYTSYKKLVGSFKTAVGRLVALHTANALIAASKIKIDDAYRLDLLTWAATKDLLNRKRYFSLCPLLGAYATKEVNECLAHACANKLVFDLRDVAESSTKELFSSYLDQFIVEDNS